MQSWLLSLFLVLTVSNLAWAQVPACDTPSGPIGVNNGQVLNWKQTTQNEYRSRGHIQGTLVKIFPDVTGHHHFSVQIGSQPTDLIEVIYNEDFGGVPPVQEGSQIEACGDYITATQDSGGYPPSPDGAILHWVHMSPDLARHPSGFLIIDGVLCGQNAESAGPKHGGR